MSRKFVVVVQNQEGSQHFKTNSYQQQYLGFTMLTDSEEIVQF